MKVGFVGGGTMAEAIISALLRDQLAEPEEIVVGEPLAQRRQELAERYKISVTADNAKAIRGAETVVLAVKPNQFPAVAARLAGRLSAKQTVVSIMAGVTIQTLRDSLKHPAVVRVMPNPPAQVGEGMCAWTAAAEVDEETRAGVRRLLEATGKAIAFDDERFIDIATAVSGSGAGFVFLLMEAFIDGAVHLGLPRKTASEMVDPDLLGVGAAGGGVRPDAGGAARPDDDARRHDHGRTAGARGSRGARRRHRGADRCLREIAGHGRELADRDGIRSLRRCLLQHHDRRDCGAGPSLLGRHRPAEPARVGARPDHRADTGAAAACRARMGMIDVTPMVAILILVVIQQVVASY